MMEVYIWRVLDIGLENWFNNKMVIYEGKLHRVISTDSFGPSRENKNRFVLVSGDAEEGAVLWITKVLSLFSCM